MSVPTVSQRLDQIRRVPNKLRRLVARWVLQRRYIAEDPGAPASDLPLEVLIPVIAKDLPTLPLCVASVRQFIRHPLRNIYLITRPNEQMRAIAAELGTGIINENELLAPESQNLQYRVGGVDRSGWIKQQLVKLGGDRLVGTDRFLVVDADTAFVRPIVFCRDGRDLLFCGDEYSRAYYDSYSRLTGLSRCYKLTFVAHHMLFNRIHLAHLRHTIEQRTQRRWDLAIINGLDPGIQSCFSEYELYGNFCFWVHSASVTVRYRHNISVGGNRIPTLEEAIQTYGRSFFTASFHSYLRAAAPERTSVPTKDQLM